MKMVQTENPIHRIFKLQHERQQSFAFNQIIKSRETALMGVSIVQRVHHTYVATINGVLLYMTKFHNILGHCGDNLMNSTAKAIGIILMGKLNKCMNCALDKIQKQNVLKENLNKM